MAGAVGCVDGGGIERDRAGVDIGTGRSDEANRVYPFVQVNDEF